MAYVAGWSWSQMTKTGIATVDTGSGTEAYRITEKSDCDHTVLSSKLAASDPLFDTPLTNKELVKQ